MNLSELKTGEKAVIIKVKGHGGFRKRIVEMGFIRGQQVEVLLNAPLQDPVKYKIMGYEVSLRRSEAQMIEISTELPSSDVSQSSGIGALEISDDCGHIGPHAGGGHPGSHISVALVGNPNCGKTSMFNFASGAHERVGNYSGVTVDAKEGHTTWGGYSISLVDLPGTYSLSAYSPEELYVRKQIIEKTPDIIINVIDASNLERNLYLTTQLVDMHLTMVCALNMWDEFEQRGDECDLDKLQELFGVPMIPTSFKTGKGLDRLMQTVVDIYEADNGRSDSTPPHRHIHINHGPQLESAIDSIRALVNEEEQLRHRYSTRYLAIKLFEGDSEAIKLAHTLPGGRDIIVARDREAHHFTENTQVDPETAIMDAKYGFIHGALMEAGFHEGTRIDTYQTTHSIDALLTNRWLGFPLFFALLWLMFQTTFSIGQYPMDWIESGVEWLGQLVSDHMTDGPLKAMLADGVIGGVGSVIVFLPQILILYAFISFMEDSGYMARAAFIMDKFMHKMGLHGKSFIPLIMGFGCNVPAIMATRTIESRRSRLITMLIMPMMSCSARLPIYIMVTGTFFAPQLRSTVMLSLYVIGIIMAIIMSRVFSRFLIKGEDTPFVMELPPYRFPTSKAILRHTWEKGKQYLRKMGGIILCASLVVWALSYFPHDESLSRRQQQEQSYIGRMGKFVEPVFTPMGFDWKLDVGIISGVGAKEIVASTMGVLYADDETLAEADGNPQIDNARYERMRRLMERDGITPLTAWCFLIFVLLYFPCLATIAAIRSESGSWRWALFSAAYTTLLAWIVSALVYQIGSLFT